jgi:hypothetical protein
VLPIGSCSGACLLPSSKSSWFDYPEVLMHGRGGMWAVVFILFIIAAAGPCSGQGRSWPGPASSNADAAIQHVGQSSQQHAAPVRLLAAADAMDLARPSSAAAAAGGVKASLDPARSSSVPGSSNAKLFSVSACRRRFCTPEPATATYPRK